MPEQILFSALISDWANTGDTYGHPGNAKPHRMRPRVDNQNRNILSVPLLYLRADSYRACIRILRQKSDHSVRRIRFINSCIRQEQIAAAGKQIAGNAAYNLIAFLKHNLCKPHIYRIFLCEIIRPSARHNIA